jgi:hypothetical protein
MHVVNDCSWKNVYILLHVTEKQETAVGWRVSVILIRISLGMLVIWAEGSGGFAAGREDTVAGEGGSGESDCIWPFGEHWELTRSCNGGCATRIATHPGEMALIEREREFGLTTC